jgi:hypothetical protein
MDLTDQLTFLHFYHVSVGLMPLVWWQYFSRFINISLTFSLPATLPLIYLPGQSFNEVKQQFAVLQSK